MKKLLVILILISSGFGAQSQEKETSNMPKYPLTLTLSAGNALAGSIGGYGDSTVEEERLNAPVFQLHADYNFSPKFSLGFIGAYHPTGMEVSDETSGLLLEKGTINRYYLGLRGLFLYGKNEKIQLYSGFKLGYVLFRANNVDLSNGATESLIEDNENRNRTSIGIIPIGARFFFTEQIAFNLQISIGAPTFLSAGFAYRL